MIGAIVFELKAVNSDSLPLHHGQQLHGLCFKIMEDFNNVMAEAFVFGPIGLSIAQHSVVRAIGMLLYRDPESSKQIYQLMMK